MRRGVLGAFGPRRHLRGQESCPFMTQQVLSKVSMSQSAQLPRLVVLGQQPLGWKLEMENHSIEKLENLLGR